MVIRVMIYPCVVGTDLGFEPDICEEEPSVNGTVDLTLLGWRTVPPVY